MSTRKTNSLQERFRKEFLEELPERMDHVERLILAIGKDNLPSSGFDELFRSIHSIKGSSSTFGLQAMAAVCHPFEEIIQQANEEKALTPQTFVPIALSYLDLLRQNLDAARTDNENYDQTERQLTALNQKVFRQRFSVAIVVGSRMLKDICRQAVAQLNARIVEFDDSLNALHRILNEPFHAMIIASEVYPVRGEALIAAINLSYRHGRGLQTILLSADKQKAGYVNREVDPDFIVLRDQHCMNRLYEVLQQIHAQQQKEQP